MSYFWILATNVQYHTLFNSIFFSKIKYNILIFRFTWSQKKYAYSYQWYASLNTSVVSSKYKSYGPQVKSKLLIYRRMLPSFSAMNSFLVPHFFQCGLLICQQVRFSDLLLGFTCSNFQNHRHKLLYVLILNNPLLSRMAICPFLIPWES